MAKAKEATLERASSDEFDVRMIPLNQIFASSQNPRTDFDDESFAELVSSVSAHGVLQAITVRPGGPGEDNYEVVIGERRFRAAARTAADTGRGSILARIIEVDDETALLQAIAENLHRDDLKPLELAAAWSTLIEKYGYTQAKIAERFGKTQSVVSQTVALLGLPSDVKLLIAGKQLAGSHGMELISMKGFANEATVTEYATRAADQGWSVKKLRTEADALFESLNPKLDIAEEPPVSAPELKPWRPSLHEEVEVTLKSGSTFIGIVNAADAEKGLLVAGEFEGTRVSQYFHLDQLKPSKQTTIADCGAPVSAEVDSPTAVSEAPLNDPFADIEQPEGDATADPEAAAPDTSQAEPDAPVAEHTEQQQTDDDKPVVTDKRSSAAPVSYEKAAGVPPSTSPVPAAKPQTPIDAAKNVTPAAAPAAPTTPPGWTSAMVKIDDYEVLKSQGLWPLSAIIEELAVLRANSLPQLAVDAAEELHRIYEAHEALKVEKEQLRVALLPDSPASPITTAAVTVISHLDLIKDKFGVKEATTDVS